MRCRDSSFGPILRFKCRCRFGRNEFRIPPDPTVVCLKKKKHEKTHEARKESVEGAFILLTCHSIFVAGHSWGRVLPSSKGVQAQMQGLCSLQQRPIRSCSANQIVVSEVSLAIVPLILRSVQSNVKSSDAGSACSGRSEPCSARCYLGALTVLPQLGFST